MRSNLSWPHTFLVSALVLIGLALGASPSPPAPQAYGVSVTVGPGKVEGGLRFIARVSDAATHKVVAGSDLTVRAGETGSAESEEPPLAKQALVNVSLRPGPTEGH